ncbi:MAG: hypothetical protein E7639_04690 [Ruminococcaceae bacterium]|nr:hypothetical protein [Oscillospiraceae bacterium]
MLRGCQKQMIVLQTQQSAIFESAFFVLRPENGSAQHDDMLAEANRIIGEGVTVRKKRRRFWWALASFLLGALLGAGIFALFSFLYRG